MFDLKISMLLLHESFLLLNTPRLYKESTGRAVLDLPAQGDLLDAAASLLRGHSMWGVITAQGCRGEDTCMNLILRNMAGTKQGKFLNSASVILPHTSQWA